MNNINVFNNDAATNVTNIKNAFDTYVTGYFGKIETDTTSSDTYKYVKFYLDSSSANPDMTLAVSVSTGLNDVVKLTVGSSTFDISINSSGGSNRVQRVIVTDNGVVLQMSTGSGSYAHNVVICKAETGNVIVLFHGNTSISSVGSNYSSSSGEIRVVDLNNASSNYYKHNITYNSSNQVVGVPFVSLSGGASHNVYLPITRCFASIQEAFKYQINGENYVGIGYNTIVIKSE